MLDFFKNIGFLFLELGPYMLLGIFFVAVLHVFVKKEFIAQHLGSHPLWDSVKAAVLGVPLPLCSCGVVPTSVFFSKNGASPSAVISFLISTPQTGVESITATYGMLGPVFAIFRPVAAFVSGIFGGIAVSFLGNPSINTINDETGGSCCSSGGPGTESCNSGSCATGEDAEKGNIFVRAYRYAFVEFLDDISIQFVVGLFIAGIVSVIFPDNFFERYGLGSGIWAMILMIVAGVPMYICATASIPIAIALMAKGISPGAAFVFLAVGPMTNAASLTILYKILKGKVLTVYLATGIVFALIFGTILDIIFANGSFALPAGAHVHGNHAELGRMNYIPSALFGLALLASLFRYAKAKLMPKNNFMDTSGSVSLRIEGMSCNHCVDTIERSIRELNGVTGVTVDLRNKSAKVSGTVSAKKLCETVGALGYSCSEQKEKEKALFLQIEGMSCNHCVAAVERSLKSVSGVTDVSVDLRNSSAKVNGSADIKELCSAVEDSGYTCVEKK